MTHTDLEDFVINFVNECPFKLETYDEDIKLFLKKNANNTCFTKADIENNLLYYFQEYDYFNSLDKDVYSKVERGDFKLYKESRFYTSSEYEYTECLEKALTDKKFGFRFLNKVLSCYHEDAHYKEIEDLFIKYLTKT